eukprot:jgi/Galph1/2741/GphlegSOOS_G1429.1
MLSSLRRSIKALLSLRYAAPKTWEHTAATHPAEKPVVDPIVEPETEQQPAQKDTLGIISGIPDKHLQRRVKIYKPPRTATQQGRGSKYAVWKLEFEKLEEGDRWTNPLMGWTSTGDPLSQTAVYFPDKESAVEYAKRYGLSYMLYEPEEEEERIRSFNAYGKSMVHQWNHNGVPKYEDEE